jgi:hypothetical protein
MRPRIQAKTATRGYGGEHQKLRRQYADQLEREGVLQCWRCGRPILPGMKWHLGHDDWDRSIYRGPEHARENVRAPHLKKKRNKAAWREVWSRRWW